MTLPENIRDLGVDDENDLLYVGQQNKNWVVVSMADATYGAGRAWSVPDH